MNKILVCNFGQSFDRCVLHPLKNDQILSPSVIQLSRLKLTLSYNEPTVCYWCWSQLSNLNLKGLKHVTVITQNILTDFDKKMGTNTKNKETKT